MKILTSTQTDFLNLFRKSPLASQFYLTGGTALAEFYLEHRLSEDLDFFSDKPIILNEVQAFVEELKHKLHFKNVEYKKLYDRNIYIFKNNEILKIEFTLYPFKNLGERKTIDNMKIASLDDIAAGKLFAILDRVETKDFIDIFFLFKNNYPLLKLKKLAEKKFEMKIDSVSLGSSLIVYKDVDPTTVNLLKNIERDAWNRVFASQIKTLQVEFLR